jgi:large subunit ribosomal protein L18
MEHQKAKRRRQLRRRRHVRRKMFGTAERPRLTVFRSSKHIYAQIVNDEQGVTMAAVSSLAAGVRDTLPKVGAGKSSAGPKAKKAGTPYGGNKKAAEAVGQRLAELAKEKGISKVAFDRGHYRYHGRIQALADAARKGGLQF